MSTNVLCNRKEILCYSHISIEQQKLRRQRDSQALISICKTMELARTIEQMGNLIYKSRIIVIILNAHKNAIKTSQIEMFVCATTAVFNCFCVNGFRLFKREIYNPVHLFTLLKAFQDSLIFLHQSFKFIAGCTKELLVFILVERLNIF